MYSLINRILGLSKLIIIIEKHNARQLKVAFYMPQFYIAQ